VLYELLAGRPPFQGPLGALMAKIMTEPPPPPSHWRADLGPALDAICAKALAKKPADRYPSMRAFAAALEDYLRGRYQLPDPEPDSYVIEPADEDRPLDEHDAAGLFRAMAARQARPPRPRVRRRRRWARPPEWLAPLALGVVALVGVGYGLWSFFHYLDHRKDPPGWNLPGVALDPARVAEERRRRREADALEAALNRWRANPGDRVAHQDLNDWLRAPAGRRTDLPPEINLGLGQYLILERSLWADGLGRLVLSSAGPWREAADLDLTAAGAEDDPPLWVRCGDGWWGLSDGRAGPANMTGPYRARLRERAGLWYRKALPSLGERDRQRVEGRLGVVTPAPGVDR
jgi:hypothetical protein